MATRSKIGIMSLDKTLRGIYCHWDGYPEHVGKLLLKHYNSPGLANQLMDLGHLSSLGSMIGEQHPFSWHEAGLSPSEYDARWGNVCTAYGRDRGEANTAATNYTSLRDFEAPEAGEEWLYVWHPLDHEWQCRPADHGEWRSVAEELLERANRED